MSKSRWALVIGLIAMSTLLALYIVALSSNPAIARMKGDVISIQPENDETRVCLARPVDAGSTYGSRRYADGECWSGILQGHTPTKGECIILRSQGESSMLTVEHASGCR